MKLRTIGIVLLIAALIGSSVGVVMSETDDAENQNGHCDNWTPGNCCDMPPDHIHKHDNNKAGND